MFQKKELEALIREMFSDAEERGYTEEEAEGLLDEVDFDALTQAIHHDAEIVYAFRADTKCEIGRDYRGKALFDQRATLLYEDVHEVLYDAAIVGRSTELWLLENMTVAVVSCVTIMVGNEDVVAQYRVFKSWDWEDCGIEDLEDFAADLKAMCSKHDGQPYEQMSQKYSEEYYALKAELATLQEQLSTFENAGGRAQKFLKLTERYAAFTDLTPAILNEFISRIEVHERDQKRARYAIQHISIYFNYIGKFENEVTQLTEPTEQEIRQMREEIEEAKKEKSRAYHRQYSREYRARNLEKQREYDRMKAWEYRTRRKAQAAAAQPTQ